MEVNLLNKLAERKIIEAFGKPLNEMSIDELLSAQAKMKEALDDYNKKNTEPRMK